MRHCSLHYIKLVLVSLVFIVGLSACTQRAPEYKATNLSHIDWNIQFQLVDHNNQSAGLGNYKGRVVAIFFGYTHCPHVCSPALANLARIRERLGSSAEDLQVLFTTVDPEYDTASQLSEFLPKFDPTFIGLTGQREKINEVVRNFKVYVEKQPDENNQRIISHPGGVFVIDRKGRLRLYMKEGMPMEDMVSDFRLLLSE